MASSTFGIWRLRALFRSLKDIQVGVLPTHFMMISFILLLSTSDEVLCTASYPWYNVIASGGIGNGDVKIWIDGS
jgi:lipoprotein signal peptidase